MSNLIRTRLQHQRSIRRLFENLASFRKDRTSTLTEIPIPAAHRKLKKERPVTLTKPPLTSKPTRRRVITHSLGLAPAVEQEIRKWESIEEIQNAALLEGGESEVRIFEQTIGTPKMVNERVGELSGIEERIIRKLEKVLLFLDRNPLALRKEVFYWLGKTTTCPWVLKAFTDYAWRIIWALETDEIPTFRSKLVGDLMVAAGIPLSDEQEIAYISGLFWNNERNQAMCRWRNRLRGCPAPRAFWNLGVRLFALDQNPDEAYDTIRKMKKWLIPINYRDYIPVVMAYNHTGRSDRAREAYDNLKKCAEKDKESIKTNAYDDISMSFLDAGEVEMGLSVYKDMILTGSKRLEKIYKGARKGTSPSVAEENPPPEAKPLGKHEEQNLADLPLEELKSLSHEKWDQYFIEGWMQSLLRMGRVDLVYVLVTNNFPCGFFRKDSMHFNWVIKGFLEEGSVEMAEYVAEAMIQERLRCVQLSSTEPNPAWAGEKGQPVILPPPPEGQQKDYVTPAPASRHTFSLLIQYFSRRQRAEKVASYSALMSQCGITPPSYICNHILYALYRLHDHERFNKVLERMLEMPGIQLDAETWNVVWSSQHRRQTRSGNVPEDPPHQHHHFYHRYLFHHMIRTLCAENAENKPYAVQSFWKKLIKCFVISQDFLGALVALHAGVKKLGVRIDAAIVREVTVGVLKSRRRLVPDPDNPGRVVRMTVGKDTVDESVAYLISMRGEFMRRNRRGKFPRDAKSRKNLFLQGNLSSITQLLMTELVDRPGYTQGGFLEKAVAVKAELGVEDLIIEL